jgi:sugar phosphate permease
MFRRATIRVLLLLCVMYAITYIDRVNVSTASSQFGAELNLSHTQTIGPMWSIPMDIAPKHAGVASGLMNTGSALSAIISPVVGGWMIDRTGNWNLPFIVSMALMVLGIALSFMMQPNRPLETERRDVKVGGLGTPS